MSQKRSPMDDALVNYGTKVGTEANADASTERGVYNESVLSIMASGLFDYDFYLSKTDVAFDKEEKAICHYLEEGWKAGISPHPLFDVDYYLENNEDVVRAGMEPLTHYINYGAAERRCPHLLFRVSYLLSQLEGSDAEIAKLNPLLFYIKNPYKARPVALFDGCYYKENYLGKSPGQHPLAHYLSTGYIAGNNPHPLFDSKYYLDHNDVADDVPPLVDYESRKLKAKVRCHPLFDPEFYVQKYPDVLSSGIDPLSHYVVIGSGSHYWPNPVFHPSYYEQSIGKEKNLYDSLLTHFVEKGCKDGISPCFWFDQDFYTKCYPFTQEDSRTPLGHYLEDGWKHDFLPSEKFSPKYIRGKHAIPSGINPLAYYVQNLAGKETLPEKAWSDPVPECEQLEVVYRYFKSAPADKPKVSVIIPVYNNFDYTLRCLYSIAISTDETPIEVIVADDLSSDETEKVLSHIEGIKHIRNPENLGFLRSCNNAALSAKGDYILLLNNDTAVLDGWVDRLVETFENESRVGLVGSKLLYPNGLLQEAGGILWKDGAANYGKFDDPERPEYSYLRQVDYVSGAAVMVPLDLWRILGGFDDRYAPAYCEDSDLCLQIRNMGLQVLMQPASKVVHFEGISSGTDVNSGVKKYQVENSKKLAKKWERLLSENGVSGDFSRACVDRNRGPRMLIVDATIPTPDQDAGSVTVWYFLKIFRQLGYQITFIPENLLYRAPYTNNIQALGVECIYAPYCTNVTEYLELHSSDFDVVMLYRVNNGGRFYETVRKFAPQAKIIFDTVDIHFLREERQAKMEKDKHNAVKILEQAHATKERELFLIKNSDQTIVLSEYEKTMLARDYGINNTFVVPIVLEVTDTRPSFSERRDIAFIGGYQHTPNVDAVLYFVESIWPKVKEKVPGIKFYVIGSKPPVEILELPEQDADIIVTGYVDSLDPWLGTVRLTIAPLRYGAGIKGKIGSSLSYGVPCVATKVAAEGMGLTDGRDILMSADEGQFVDHLVSAYNDNALWDELSENGMRFIENNYSIEAIRKRLLWLLNAVGAPPFYVNNPFSSKKELMRLVEQPPTNDIRCSHNSKHDDRVLLDALLRSIGRERGCSIFRLDDLTNLLIDKVSIVSLGNDNEIRSKKCWDGIISDNGCQNAACIGVMRLGISSLDLADAVSEARNFFKIGGHRIVVTLDVSGDSEGIDSSRCIIELRKCLEVHKLGIVIQQLAGATYMSNDLLVFELVSNCRSYA